MARPLASATRPTKRICPSVICAIRLIVSRHCLGKRNGKTPSISSIKPSATANKPFTSNPHYFFGLVVAPGPVLLKYLKNSEFGSMTIKSFRFLKLAR